MPLVDLETLRTTVQVASLLGITPRRIRQVAAQMKIGRRAGGTFLFTPDEVEKLRHRRTDRTPVRVWLREKSQAAWVEKAIERVVDRAVARVSISDSQNEELDAYAKLGRSDK